MFDATGMAPTERLVRIGTGRDAKDVAFATIFGNVKMLKKILTVEEGDSTPESTDELANAEPLPVSQQTA